MNTGPQCSTGYPDSHTTCSTHGAQLNKMRKGKRTGWLLALLIAITVLPALSQQVKGPTMPPKKPIAKPAAPSATLLVICDLACNWNLDGEPKGRIDEERSAKVKVDLGQHIVVAVTVDGPDKIQQLTEVKGTGQTVMSLELQPVRDARLKAEQEARDKAAREKQEKERLERERVAREMAKVTWTDPATGLVWTKEDNGSDVTWDQANDYCGNLRLAGHSGGWRLPTIDELRGIYDANAGGYHVKGNLQLSSKRHWSNSSYSASNTEYWRADFSFYYGGRQGGFPRSVSTDMRALCVFRPEE